MRNILLKTQVGSESGLTLIELMVTLAILAIMVAFAVPSFQQLIEQNKAATSANEILSGLAATRSEAVQKNTRSRFCFFTKTSKWELRDFSATPKVLRQGTVATDVTVEGSDLGESPVADALCVDYRSDALPYKATGDFSGELLTDGKLTVTKGAVVRKIHVKTGSVYVE